MNNKVLYNWILIILLLAVSCSKENVIETLPLPQDISSNVTNKNVLRYANAKFGKIKGNTINIEPLCVNGDTLAYVLNYGTGWELLSGDERYTPILAKGEGIYDIEGLNPGQRIWLESEMEIIKAIKDKYIIVPEDECLENQKFWNRIKGPVEQTKAEGDPTEGWELVDILEMGATSVSSGHLIETQWGQRSPWNACVPYASGTTSRCAAGCVAVAGAQILKFIHDTLGKPTTFYTSGSCSGYESSPVFSFPDSSLSSLAWDNMALTPYESSSKTYQSALLVGWIGSQVDMDYSLNESAASSKDLKDLIEDLSIDCKSGGYNASVVWTQLKNKWPVYIEAWTDDDEGHAWIIDGYQSVTIEYRYVYVYTEHDSPYNEYGEEKFEYEYETNNYIMMNWGWNNYIDNSSYALAGAAGWYGGGYIFTHNKKIMYDFK